MKKTLAILALALFIGGISVPAIAAINNIPTQIILTDDDPKKKEKKAETKKEATKKSDGCATEKKAEGEGCETKTKSESTKECG